MSAAEPRARRSGGLTPKGLIVASCYRLRNAAEDLDPVEQQRLAVELRNIVARVCAPFLRPVA